MKHEYIIVAMETNIIQGDILNDVVLYVSLY